MWYILDNTSLKPQLQLFFSSELADWLKKFAWITSPLTFLNVSGTANPLIKTLVLLISGLVTRRGTW